jgi:hypothetical protein
MRGHEERLQARLEEGVRAPLEFDDLLPVGDRRRALGVGESADKLVGDVDADEDPDLAPEIAPILGQPSAE